MAQSVKLLAPDFDSGYDLMVVRSSPVSGSALSVGMFIREREGGHPSGRGAEREGDRIPSRLCTGSAEPSVGLELRNCEIVT